MDEDEEVQVDIVGREEEKAKEEEKKKQLAKKKKRRRDERIKRELKAELGKSVIMLDIRIKSKDYIQYSFYCISILDSLIVFFSCILQEVPVEYCLLFFFRRY